MKHFSPPVSPRLALGILALSAIPTTDAANPVLERRFTQTVQPFIAKYCAGCHSGANAAAALDLKSYNSIDAVLRDHSRWQMVSSKVAAQQMPPKQMPQPTAEERQQLVEWIQAVRGDAIRRTAGDPGPVLARRLTNAEYNYTIRDLTGVDMQPAKEFPVDPANQAGFDNSGESLTMSPALMNKYLQAAREVSNHMVLTPDGIDFAPYPMLVETDREKYAIQRIVNFYKAQPTDYADYFEASWRYKNRAGLHQPAATLTSIAVQQKISARYLPLVWNLVAVDTTENYGPLAKLRRMFASLPAPGEAKPEEVRAQCVAMRDFIVRIRKDTSLQFAAPKVKGLAPTSQSLMIWKLRQYAAHRREFDPEALRNDTDAAPSVTVPARYPGLGEEAAMRAKTLQLKDRAADKDLIVPSAEREQYAAAFKKLAYVFPDAFFISERGRFYPDDSEDKGRLLSAGFHNVMGYFRDDTPLIELILDEKGHKQLERLWDEFDFISDYTERTWVQYFFNQSGEVEGHGRESGSTRPPDKAVAAQPVIMDLKAKYLAKWAASPANDPVAKQAIIDHYDRVNATLRALDKERAEAEPKQMEALLKLAARAYRRPLTLAERKDMLAYYAKIRKDEGLTHEEAIRDSIVSVLMSPDFCYRIDLLDAQARPVAQNAALRTGAPLSDYALASRLSYFLWASMPDDKLLAKASGGTLRNPAVLQAEVRRMLKDERASGFVTEFAGNWLDFRRFETHNAVDRQRFPTWDNDLREAMFEEPVHLIVDAFQNNRSALDLIYGNYTFVNPVLAKHYGMPEVKGDNNTWVRVDDAGQYGRGGLLPMSVFLTQSSPGLRTSPVKRGYWVVRRVLGEVIPPPPPVVPELPSDEAKSDLPLRDMLAKHRENPLCSQCHARFDTFGLALENYGPIGEARTKDLAGRPVDTNATFPGGVQGSGFQGVQAYIRGHRESDYIDNLSRKLLAYSLNRSLQLSDEPLVDRMKTRLAENGYKMDTLVETVVSSSQFLNRRVSTRPAPQAANVAGVTMPPTPVRPLARSEEEKKSE